MNTVRGIACFWLTFMKPERKEEAAAAAAAARK